MHPSGYVLQGQFLPNTLYVSDSSDERPPEHANP